MLKHFLVFLITGLLFISCKTKESCGRCPYQAQMDYLITPSDVNSSTLLPADRSMLNTADILPEIPKTFSEFLGEAYNSAASALSSNIIEKAFEYKGVRYRRGGLSKKGLDCSGFVYKTFSSFGISLPRTSIDMSKSVDEISREEAKKGDLIFFKTNGRKRINHVGLIVEVNNEEIKFIHASVKYGVIVSSTDDPYYSKTFSKVGRVLGS